MEAEITEVGADGRPTEVRFEFALALEDPSWTWLTWSNGRYVPFQPPPVGGRAKVPGFNPFEAMRHGLGLAQAQNEPGG